MRTRYRHSVVAVAALADSVAIATFEHLKALCAGPEAFAVDCGAQRSPPGPPKPVPRALPPLPPASRPAPVPPLAVTSAAPPTPPSPSISSSGPGEGTGSFNSGKIRHGLV